ncbi:MAG: hypothetical protein K5872_22235 [Rhizobiaceae bacterium]|nr:hypothetical protein [Rhizobiaceae bacterium]MCV0408940.1 hypothetical protein [Rhizobiaceae bacterium]
MSDIDPHSQTWAIVKDAVDRMAEQAITRLQTRGLPAADTEHERGRLSALRDVLALAEPKPAQKPRANLGTGY